LDALLNDVEVRVLGCLIEKETTTPEYYPLSLNALTNACNQSSNRYPVVHFDEQTVAGAIDALRQKQFVHIVHRDDARVVKYRHVIAEKLGIDTKEIAVMSVLMLRGAQTVGEIRTRTNRMFDFESLEQVEAVLNLLMTREPTPLIARLPRQTGQKDVRYAHLLSGEVTLEQPPAQSAEDRIARLEDTTEQLRREVDDLRSQLDQFRKQFE
jgi:uncharacterized protein YceH (UPF0502 family)